MIVLPNHNTSLLTANHHLLSSRLTLSFPVHGTSTNRAQTGDTVRVRYDILLPAPEYPRGKLHKFASGKTSRWKLGSGKKPASLEAVGSLFSALDLLFLLIVSLRVGPSCPSRPESQLSFLLFLPVQGNVTHCSCSSRNAVGSASILDMDRILIVPPPIMISS